VEGSVTLEFRDKALFKGKVAQMFYPSDAGFFSGLLYLAFLHRSLTKDKLKKWLTQK
jgi:hypothetical protein